MQLKNSFLEQLLAQKMAGETQTITLHSELHSDEVVEENSTPPSPTVFDMDLKTLRHGQRLASARQNPNVLADAYCACYQPNPIMVDNCESPERLQWFKELLESDEHNTLRTVTELDGGLSDIAARNIAEQWFDYSRNTKSGDALLLGGRQVEDSIEQEFARVRSTQNAAREAKRSIDDAIAFAIGCGAEPNAAGQIDPAELAKAFDKVRNDLNLRRIFESAGRFRRFARAAQKSKVKHGYDDLVGVKLDNSIPHLLNSELCKLCDDDLELDLLKRLVERQAMCRDYNGVEKLGLGPVVVLVDESASMRGEKIINAKALALTMGWIAQQQKRWIAFVSFNHYSEGERICMPPGKWDQDELVKWITGFSGGGTELTVLLDTLPKTYWKEFRAPKGKTDIIVITDGAVSAEDDQAKFFLKWKQEQQVKCYGLILDASPGGLRHVCDKYWLIDSISLDEGGIKEMLSI